MITRSETPTTPSNYHLRDLDSGDKIQLTSFPDPTPQIRGIKKQLVTYEREDGVPLSATLYLPPNYEEGTRLPLLVWAYPHEYNDAQTAAQVTGSPSRFNKDVRHHALDALDPRLRHHGRSDDSNCG